MKPVDCYTVTNLSAPAQVVVIVAMFKNFTTPSRVFYYCRVYVDFLRGSFFFGCVTTCRRVAYIQHGEDVTTLASTLGPIQGAVVCWVHKKFNTLLKNVISSFVRRAKNIQSRVEAEKKWRIYFMNYI